MLAIFDPFSGIAGDMTLGALVELGLSEGWLKALPGVLELDGVEVRITRVTRAGLAATKVDFGIPDQPHGRHLAEIRGLVERAALPQAVRHRALQAFAAIADIEGEAHGVSPDDVHLHEVGAVDAILDVVGTMWGLEQLGVTGVRSTAISLGDGFVKAAHGVLPVPAPAALKLLSGLEVRPGPPGSGELVTPTGAAILRVLSEGPPPSTYVPIRVGMGAGTKDLVGRPNVLRVVLAEGQAAGPRNESVVMLATDIDDMPAEALAAAADACFADGALDVVLTPTLMKKGRPGVRLEVVCAFGDVSRLESVVFLHTTTLGIRRQVIERSTLARSAETVEVMGHSVRVKVAHLPNGQTRAKPEFDDVVRAARSLGKSVGEVSALAVKHAERQ